MNRPQARDSLPKYLAEGIPKQDDSTLEDISEYVTAVLEHRQQKQAEIEAEEIPSEAEQIGTDESGTFMKETVPCGDQNCECMNGGEEHGPYIYKYIYEDGTLRSEYLGKPSNVDIDV
jgi:hypothetical protein